MNLNHVNISGLRPIVGDGRKLYIETYGCQMNAGDSEVVLSILQGDGFRYTEDPAGADVILINTCSIRDNAEQRIWGRLRELRQYKKKNKGLLVGVIGCMAERLREKLIDQEELVNLVAGPDAYRDLPRLLREAGGGAKAVNVLLSGEETYAEISPVRLDKNGVSAYISIMRGCNNMCSYCVVPYTRGAERSRDPQTILREARELFDGGYREVTLLGQNVNSYRWENGETVAGFADLLGAVASVDPKLRVRFSTSHPKDLSDEVLHTMARYPNLCRAIHLPAQSGSTRMLELMNRKYTREWYLGRIEAIRRILPGCSISTDLIAGFCTETDDDHRQTLSLMEEVGYASAFMFKYSERPNTKAARHMADDVPDGVKTARLNEIIALQNELSLRSNRLDVGREFEVLVEGVSKRSDRQLFGRTSQNKVVVFDRGDARVGDYVRVRVTDCSSATLHGQRVE
ncbi:tRNA (N6-isopentenyl adenosine(37)-C2)-methylthiotransferase MiaB [Alistipes indistinctus]|jgi:tRNA-i(6)A37 thiotransferase enzyme miaB|uniref:tRNA (N6-isopentenyl adenosine(37)-C2)-methylthiotransferase MiaB n=1 Tax=Alistipes indistinctus TaxID=626932 RepID=UPI00122F649F|nr:tRNA (N6-isopentenyl adenosine(37)-C2)-methylthiotransferase MiaB [Alistipes indistinctus]KAA3145096.1 tRNA (N6-isopentenyl adenosine(37)-C2)-methylthiotransferase MiaB [Alistipes indistinctus]BCG54699.1 tRNA-2-methylthio-N(6)-dimethylallyladenosine synthase [Alistipes indistinctus]